MSLGPRRGPRRTDEPPKTLPEVRTHPAGLHSLARAALREMERDTKTSPISGQFESAVSRLCQAVLMPEQDLDLDLLRKLASGEGGRRTGALRRAGYLEWTVTEAGLRALSATDKP
jgi:hypothetical protein